MKNTNKGKTNSKHTIVYRDGELRKGSLLCNRQDTQKQQIFVKEVVNLQLEIHHFFLSIFYISVSTLFYPGAV